MRGDRCHRDLLLAAPARRERPRAWRAGRQLGGGRRRVAGGAVGRVRLGAWGTAQAQLFSVREEAGLETVMGTQTVAPSTEAHQNRFGQGLVSHRSAAAGPQASGGAPAHAPPLLRCRSGLRLPRSAAYGTPGRRSFGAFRRSAATLRDPPVAALGLRRRLGNWAGCARHRQAVAHAARHCSIRGKTAES